jgi:RNA polymerase sigma-70 factor (ECF subfamily)
MVKYRCIGGGYMFYVMLAAIEDEQERIRIADIYEKYRYKCLHIAMGITHNQQMAEDAVEDAFVEVIKQKDKILSLSCSDLLPYIVTIVKSRAINIIKKNNKISDTPIDELEEIVEAQETPVDEQVIEAIGYKRLIELIESLDEIYKVVFEMKYVQFLSNGNIADALNITQKNVEIRLYRAKLKLRKLLVSEVKSNV